MSSRPSLLAWSLVALTSLSCAKHEPPPSTYGFRLTVSNVPGEPLGNVTARVGTRVLGRTDESGALALELQGRDGQRVNVHIDCPPNHRAPARPLELALFHYASGARPEVSAVCEQERVVEAVVVRTLGAREVPLYARGERLGATDSQGIAHVLLRGEPGESVELSFDTSSLPELRPASPSVRILLGNHDDVLLAEQRFETRAKARPTPSGPRKNRAIRETGPVRIR